MKNPPESLFLGGTTRVAPRLTKHARNTTSDGAVSRKDLRMEWDEISENWAAMAKRLRADRAASVRVSRNGQDSEFGGRRGSNDVTERLPDAVSAPDHNLPQRQ